MKKKFIKIFAVSFIIGVIFIFGILYKFLDSISVNDMDATMEMPKDRVNILALGIANGLSDTIIYGSFNLKENNVDLISIPRDTYFPRQGFKGAAHKKINAAYGSKGAESSVDAVETLLNTDIHYYFIFDYNAVISVVDAIGGLKIEVPQNMDYDDPVDKLHIHFKKGQIVEKGEDVLKVIRWRKNNKGGGYKNGDLGRIEMQQKVVKAGIGKLFEGNLISNFIKIQEPIKENVKTNMTPSQIMYIAKKSKGLKEENIVFHTLPGNTKTMEGLSFFVADKDKLQTLMDEFK